MKNIILTSLLLVACEQAHCWGFFAHRKINQLAVFLLPPEMLRFYKANIQYLSDHAIDPDKRRYAVKEEGPRHYIDLDYYGQLPLDSLPRNWKNAAQRFSADTLAAHGILPWWMQVMLYRLTEAFQSKDARRILKFSAELGHYVADAHVPLHTTSNHNGQLTGQHGIHAFWESRLPELLADKEWDFFMAPAHYIQDPSAFFWNRVFESAAACDSVLQLERTLNSRFSPALKYAYEERNGLLARSYSSAYSIAYDRLLKHMPERRMRAAMHSVASCWFTAWVNAGQPSLKDLPVAAEEQQAMDSLDMAWRKGMINGKSCEMP